MEPTGMVLLLAADMVRGVLHASRVWRAPAVDHPGVHPFTGVALLHMGSARRHVAPGTGEQPHRHRGGNRPGPPRLAGRPGLPLAQAPGRPASGARGGGVQPRSDRPATPRQEGAPLPADRHGSGRPARLRVAPGRGGGTTATGPMDPPAMVRVRGHPGPYRPSRLWGFFTAPNSRCGPAPQPACRGGLDTPARRGLAPKPVLPPGAGPGAASRGGHGNRAMGGDCARHGVQVDNPCDRNRRATAFCERSPFWPPATPSHRNCEGPC